MLKSFSVTVTNGNFCWNWPYTCSHYIHNKVFLFQNVWNLFLKIWRQVEIGNLFRITTKWCWGKLLFFNFVVQINNDDIFHIQKLIDFIHLHFQGVSKMLQSFVWFAVCEVTQIWSFKQNNILKDSICGKSIGRASLPWRISVLISIEGKLCQKRVEYSNGRPQSFFQERTNFSKGANNTIVFA